MGVDGVAAGHVSTGRIWTWWWPTHWRSLAMVAAPRRSTCRPRRRLAVGVGVEVVGLDVGVEPDLAGLLAPPGPAVRSPCRQVAEDAIGVRRGGLSGGGGCGDQAERFDLADPQGAGVAVQLELVGDRGDEVVEGFEGEGVAGGEQVAGAGELGGGGVAG